MYNQHVDRNASKDGRHTEISKTPPKSSFISKRPPSAPLKFSCTDAVKADLFGSSTPQSTKYTPPKFVPLKKKETLELHKARKRRTPPTDTFSTKKTARLLQDVPNLTENDDPSVKQCPYCHEILCSLDTNNLLESTSPSTLPTNLQEALDKIETANSDYDKERKINHMLPKRRFVSNRAQFRFCQLHRLELKVKPEGMKAGYPVDLDFIGLKTRVESLVPTLKQMINNEVESPFRKIALAAYKDMGMNKARSTMGIMSRFEKTLPGYYGPKGASIIMNILNDQLLLTGFLTKEKTKPQLPLEYMQQVLVPEAGWRLIQEDLLNKRTPGDKNGTSLSSQRAMDLMTSSVDFGTKMYPTDDDAEDTLWQTHDPDEDRNDSDDKDVTGNDSDDPYISDSAEVLEYVSSDDENNND